MRVASLVLLLLFGACSGSDPENPPCANGGLNCQCVTNLECGTTGQFRCNNMLCKPPRSATVGAPCWATADCMDGNFCNTAGRCAPAGTGNIGNVCASDADCSQDLRCNIIGLGARCAAAGSSDLGDGCGVQTECVAGLYCGGTCTSFAQAFPTSGNPGDACANEGAFRAYFEVPRPAQPPKDFYRLPFPNDIRLVNGKPDMSDFYRPSTPPYGLDLTKIYLDAQAADFEGYSPVAAVTLRFSKNIDFDSLLGAVRLFNLSAGSEVGNTFAFTAQRTKWSCENRLSVQPFIDQPMVAGNTYAVVVTTAVRSAGDETPVQDPDLAAVLGATRPADESLGKAWDIYAGLRARLGADVATVATAAVFTVADVPAHMSKVAAAVGNEGDPTLSALTRCSSGGTSACGACGPDDPAFTEIHGKISMPIYQQGTAPYLTAGGNIMESGSLAVKVRDEDVCFALTIPKNATMPGGGWPLVVFAHGTGGTFRDFITNGVAAAVAGASGATFSFEAVGHGMRRGGSNTDPADIVYNVLNPRAARDIWLQGAADVLTAFKVRLLTLTVGSETIDFDAAKLVFFGHSQGATSGELALPFTSSVSAVILSGAGANLGEALAAKKKPFDVPTTLLSVLGDTMDALHPVAILLQSYFDRSDPFATASSISGKDIYMSWGTTDSYSPLATLEYNARALKLKPVAPVLEEIDPVDHSLGTPISRPNITLPAVFQYNSGGEGHFVAFQVAAAKTDWLAFITSYWATGSTNIP